MPTTYAIIQGNKYMDATLFTSNGTTQTVTNAGGFIPDLLWTKNRTTANSGNDLNDSVRGPSKYLVSYTTGAELTDTGFITSFNTNGFSIGANNYTSTNQIVAWQWTAGQNANVTNTSGTITSTVSANTTAGFSIVTFNNPTSGTYTVGHGLSAAPQVVIIKYRSSVGNWFVYNANIGYTNRLLLNTTAASGSAAYWTSAPTSTTVNFDTSFTDNPSQSLVMYCWTPIPGFSAFGSYTGNGSTDGPFVYTGFKPKFVLIKRTDTTADWVICDSTRNPYNKVTAILFPNTGDAEATADIFQFFSNGFKLNQTGGGANANGGNYIYMAFASTPFKYANAF